MLSKTTCLYSNFGLHTVNAMTCCPKQPNQAPTLRQSSDTIAALYHSAAQMMATHSLGFRSSSPALRISTCKVQLTTVEEE
jgi:hypothetical protein